MSVVLPKRPHDSWTDLFEDNTQNTTGSLALARALKRARSHRRVWCVGGQTWPTLELLRFRVVPGHFDALDRRRDCDDVRSPEPATSWERDWIFHGHHGFSRGSPSFNLEPGRSIQTSSTIIMRITMLLVSGNDPPPKEVQQNQHNTNAAG